VSSGWGQVKYEMWRWVDGIEDVAQPIFINNVTFVFGSRTNFLKVFFAAARLLQLPVQNYRKNQKEIE